MTLLRPDAVHSVDTFIATPAAIEALDLCRALAGTGPDTPRLLLLHGPPGSGKTHLPHSIRHALHGRIHQWPSFARGPWNASRT